jgi:hypothetical protein
VGRYKAIKPLFGPDNLRTSRNVSQAGSTGRDISESESLVFIPVASSPAQRNLPPLSSVPDPVQGKGLRLLAAQSAHWINRRSLVSGHERCQQADSSENHDRKTQRPKIHASGTV